MEEALCGFLARSGRGNLVRLEVVQVIERPFSLIAMVKAHTDKQCYDAVLKKIVHHPMNIGITKKMNQAEVEHAILCRLFPYFKNEQHCSVPEPIAVFPEDETYLMAYVPGVLLSEKFKAARYFSRNRNFAELCDLYRYCGRWLRIFQEVTTAEPSSTDIFSATLERCEEKLDLISEARDPRCPSNLKEVVMADLQNELQKLSSEPILTAGRHGDYGGWNIIVNDNGITVFDFLGSQVDSVAIDLLKMLVNFEDEKRFWLYSKYKIKKLRQNFLFGYGPLPKIQRPVAVICETLHRVCSLCASVVHVNGIGLRRRYEKNLSFKDHLAWLYSKSKHLLWIDTIEK